MASTSKSPDTTEMWCEEHCRVADLDKNTCVGRCRVAHITIAYSRLLEDLENTAPGPLQETISELKRRNINQDGQKRLLQIFSSIRGGGTCEIKITSEGQAVGIKWQWPLDKPLEWNKYGSKMDTGQHLKLFKLLIAASDNPKFRTVSFQEAVRTDQTKEVPPPTPNDEASRAPSQTKMVDSSSDAESTPSHHPRKRRNVSFEEAVRTDQTKEVPPPTPNHEASRETETQEHQDQDPTKFLHSPKLLRALSSKNKPKSAGKLTPEQQEQQKQKVLKDLEWKQRQKPKVLEVLDLEDTRVGKLKGLSCNDDEEFALKLLEKLKRHPEIRSLVVEWPRQQHLEAINAIDQLENLEIFADAKMRLRSGEVQLTKQKEGKLRKLKVDGLNPNTIKSLLKTNANSIEHLHVLVETPDNRPYFQDSRKRKAEKIYINDDITVEDLPEECFPAAISHMDMKGIIELAANCKEMTTICLERTMGHKKKTCPEQQKTYTAMLQKNKRCTVYCKTCDRKISSENQFWGQ
ncbi:uncharacterized protein LOC113207374 isoform X2 [Frankliniella occidentalis]|uniref:Uncharacterized protein LOC113207374 isoform X2 n=1 Tax=Frankliniella occidentalis TaxID=133901 RepID=A0A9C6XCS1_FRAOC|nr:uncharacterized protein LOC113207374 isoform X2 [Frankliniella occidentalis]